MKNILFLIILTISISGFSQKTVDRINLDSVKATILLSFEYNRVQISKPGGTVNDLIERDVSSIFKIKTFGLISDSLNTDLVKQISDVVLFSSIDVYNFIFGWTPFDCIDESPLYGLPLVGFKGTRCFLKDEEKQSPFLGGTQQVFEFGLGKCLIIFSKLDFVIVKSDGSYIVFFNE